MRIYTLALISLQLDDFHGSTPYLENMPFLVAAYIRLGKGCCDSTFCNINMEEDCDVPCCDCHAYPVDEGVLLNGLTHAVNLGLIAEPEKIIYSWDLERRPIFGNLKTLLLNEWFTTICNTEKLIGTTGAQKTVKESFVCSHLKDEGSEHTSDGTVDINKQPARRRSTGNWRACYFILGAEFTEGICFFGIQKNLVTYLTSVLHESNVDAARNVSTWTGSCFFTPLIGAFLADTCWGRYRAIVVFLSVYTIGMLVMTLSASLPVLMLSFSSSEIQRTTVYLGLYLVALGTGGIKPCTSALGADQFDSADPVERLTKGSFFNWYYFLINMGCLLSTTVLVWVQDNVGWGVGYAIPTVLMGFGLVVFVSGRNVYRYKRLGGSPLKRVSQVVIAAARNYRLKLPDDSSALLYEESGANFSTKHTSRFRFLDKAAILVPPSSGKAVEMMDPWRTCTVSQVEELKMLLQLFPVWASLLFFFAVTAQMSSTLVEQGMAMDNRIGKFLVPPASLSTFDILAVAAFIPVYDLVLVPLVRRATGRDRGLSQLQRLGVGLALSVLAMAYSASVEMRRLAAVRAGRSLNIMWQTPSYVVLGVAEVFTSVGIMEFFYDESPESMKSMGAALAQLAISAGNYLNSAVLGVVASATGRGGAPGWIPDDLDVGHLDYFFWMMAGLSALNLLLFIYFSLRYKA
ncbi:Peptide transporter PTR2 [Hordeum vulgare]|nr:Peptide transporter PTR2 [Hordeum vulgare]